MDPERVLSAWHFFRVFPCASVAIHPRTESKLFFSPSSLGYIGLMRKTPLIVLCTVPDRETAEEIANILIADNLAACVNIVPGVTSVYRWENRIEQAEELILVIKTGSRAYRPLQDKITDLHPYELPEIVAVSVQDGLPAYLDWLTQSLERSS
jgi:periplasmic divalent cation tolerance protein